MGQFQKWFSNLDAGAPVLDNSANAVNAVLHACLVTGYNTKSISQIVVASGVATVTCTGHGYPVVNALYQDLDVTVEGSATALLNGVKQITVVDINTFTYPCPGVVDGTYTGTVTCKKSPLGWSRPFTGTDKAVYARTDPAATPHVLVVEDTLANALNCRVYGAESASAIDSYLDLFPTAAQQAGGFYWTRGANTTRAKSWMVIGDGRGFYFITEASVWSDSETSGRAGKVMHYFGDIQTHKAGDNYHCLITGTATPSQSNTMAQAPLMVGVGWSTSSFSGTAKLCRDQSGMNKSMNAGIIWPSGSTLSVPNPWYPSVVDNSLLWLRDVYVREEPNSVGSPVRGRLPGLVQPIARAIDLPQQAPMLPYTMTDGSGLVAFLGIGVSSTGLDNPFGVIANQNWRA